MRQNSGGSMADRKRQIRKICVVAGLLFLNISMAVMLAQSTAQISGTVKDQTGAVLPGVEVTMTQTDTGFKRNAVTDETGSYILPNLPIGPYRFERRCPASGHTRRPESLCR